MPLPSIQVVEIAAKGDFYLFENMMAQAGFRVVPRNNDPLTANVQEEVVTAIASAITENAYYGVRLSSYHRRLKTLAEQAGYVVMIEDCGPPGSDPCEGEDEDPDGDVEMLPPVEDEASTEVQQVASLPIGTELAAEIMAVLNGEGIENDEGLHGEMPIGGDEFGPEDGESSLVMNVELGDDEFGPEEDGESLPDPVDDEEDETSAF